MVTPGRRRAGPAWLGSSPKEESNDNHRHDNRAARDRVRRRSGRTGSNRVSGPLQRPNPGPPTATIFATCSSGPPITTYPCSKQRGLISSCTALRWRRVALPLRRSTAACRQRAVTTASLTSTAGSAPTRRSTCDVPPSIPRSGEEWTEVSSVGSCSPRSALTVPTPLWRCYSG